MFVIANQGGGGEGVRRVRRGKVWLVGAGPGNPELLTVKAARLIAEAEVVAYDELVSPEVLALAPPAAERIPVGRRASGCRHHEARIHPAVIERALAGRRVVRLKGGDPFVFGRGGEEAEELAAVRIPFEVVPGISAALGAAAATHIPLTHRDASQSVTLATAHFAEDGKTLAENLPRAGTVVLYMGLGRLRETLRQIVEQGRAPGTPAAVVSKATLPDQKIVTGTLATLADRVAAEPLAAPALILVGEVVARAVESVQTVGPAETFEPVRAGACGV
jgi:uroporphyrin-III C-methyltransferase/precorrin-2 dehydrogenase/sirohydrochlorin ferrochelatase